MGFQMNQVIGEYSQEKVGLKGEARFIGSCSTKYHPVEKSGQNDIGLCIFEVSIVLYGKTTLTPNKMRQNKTNTGLIDDMIDVNGRQPPQKKFVSPQQGRYVFIPKESCWKYPTKGMREMGILKLGREMRKYQAQNKNADPFNVREGNTG